MHDDVFSALVAQGGPFAEIARKWKRKAYRSAQKIAAVLHMTEEDALQEVLLNMWDAYRTYCKQQVRYEGAIWDVAVDGIKYTLEHPTSGERIVVPRYKAEPIDKRMSAASFVYLRMVQWQSNLFALHYTVRHGYEQSTEKVTLPNGKQKSTFVRVVFEESLDAEQAQSGVALHEVLPALDTTPESAVELADIVRLMWPKLDGTARLALGIYLSAHLPLPECPSGSTDAEYVAFVLGISVEDARKALKRILRAMPKHLQAYEAVHVKRAARKETLVRSRPVQELLGGGGPACARP